MESAQTSWEIVYVNDGSTDFSSELLRGLQTSDSHVVVWTSPALGPRGRDLGGIQTAHGTRYNLMDGDFQTRRSSP